MTWLERTREFISFTSPDGNEFEALWIKNNRTLNKKLGIFELPDKTGAVIQDLDTGASRYPITFYFDGPDNDIEGERFYQSCSERGLWNINHPVKGSLDLQLMSVTEQISPVEDGNIKQISTSWIESDNAQEGISTPQLSQNVFSGIQDTNSSSYDQYIETVKQNNTVEISAIKNSALVISASVDKFLSPLINGSSEVSAQIKSIQRGITDTVSQSFIPVESLAGQIISLINLPASVSRDALSRVSSYTNFINSLSSFVPDNPFQESINHAAMIELSSISALSALSNTGVTSDLQTRSESIGLIESIFNQFETVTNSLDDSQEIFENNDIDVQYFSQSQSFSDTLTTIMTTAQFLIQKSFDLKIEKRFLLKNDEAPIITTINEYGTLGENDTNFDFFIETNQLKANDILLMKSGREVVVYV